MRDGYLEQHPKVKYSVITLALAIHAVVGVGLVNMPMLKLQTPATVAPLEITMMTEPKLVEKPTEAPTEPEPEVKPEPKPVVKPVPPPPKPVKPKVTPPPPKPVEKPKEIIKPKDTPKQEQLLTTEKNKQDNTFEIERQKERESQERENRERQERENRERQERENRERQERENRERQERENRERQERENRERQERENRERQERENRERQERENRERQERENRERQERENRERQERERNTPVELSSSEISWARQPRFNLNNVGNAGESLNVSVRLSVDKQGKITGASITKSSGNPKADRLVLQQVRTGRFNPFKRNGKPVTGNVTVPFKINVF
ncbi:energy transducer TonB [Moraxella boevrei]|uniref:energy transducer TonB n=1 Tax=Faucicola boevrei TaxID=346665 RepID=UPI003736C41C